ncbi:unnamed protein product [Paramecium sonneborni]|uniref:Transmembrane protein n=1 Tax=Paramecium sonneborni TaxID=65129 RepID=A0A8S1KQI7_9CILI|nr:unnamed protein product [Paramecium sonneborni]
MLIFTGQKLKDLSEHTQESQSNIKHLDILEKIFICFLIWRLQLLIIIIFFRLDDFPILPNLITFSANKNSFNNFDMFIEQCQEIFLSQNISVQQKIPCVLSLLKEKRNILNIELNSFKNFSYQKTQMVHLLIQKKQILIFGNQNNKLNNKYQ